MIGHDEQVAAFKSAFNGDRPHHAWLLTGPQGLGKALFAETAAIWLLAGKPAGEGFAGGTGTAAASLAAAGSHPDFRRLVRTEDDKGKLRSVIRIDEVRALQPLFRQTPSIADWRVVIVDSADEMNVASANALLKNLEEPPPQTLFFLVSHTPGRLLPTIRSRCRSLRFGRLSDVQVDAVLAATADASLDDDDRATLVQIAEGAPGRALRFAESGIAALVEQMEDLSVTPRAAAPAKALALARSLAGKAALPRYQAFLELAPAMLAKAAQTRSGPALAHVIADWEAASSLAAGAVALSLDPQMVAFDLAGRIAALAEAH
ncbi:DNA polymerase III subunit delta' [Polymorphobacter glacialis]|uniref:DNA polymerase III subunit delta n=1 Tax=Sandarakinorhabdus glacialis TaxID=1614636 RepID=A0A917E6M3_9SPHN|nr:DNA polymerase III subunit delta' [Polymorphobacter glacialis]GGE04596.1 DNA polymerase III subunit delta' [Polymorphobacter glacialis]